MQPLQHDDPRSIGTFRLQARIGAGGMATVYLGLSKGGRRAAVKVMHAEHASDPQARERLRREADAAAKAGDGYGAPFIEAAPEDETPWIATEFLPSVSVRDAVRRFGTMPAAQARSIAAGLAHALRSVHEAGIVHLDVKPGNVLLTDDGVRLVDFGTARELGDDGRTAAPAPAGTRGFMSPEQAEGARLGPAGDVYAFGATLAFACTGEPSTEDSSWPDDFADEGLRELAARCMAPDPSDRPTVPELIEQLAEADEPWTSDELEAAIAASAELPPAEPKASRRRVLLGFGAAAVLGGGAAALVPLGSEAERSNGRALPLERSAVAAAQERPSRLLTFQFTGDGPLISLTYTVNGEPTTLEDVELPWEETVEIPPLPEESTYHLEFEYPPGEIDMLISIDGFQVGTGEFLTIGTSSTSEVEGSG